MRWSHDKRLKDFERSKVIFLGRKQSEESFLNGFYKKLIDVLYFILFEGFEVFFVSSIFNHSVIILI